MAYFRGFIMKKTSLDWLSEQVSHNYIADYKPFTFVDGEGVRCALYVSGCLFACPGCYNVAAQNFKYGTPYSQELEQTILHDLKQSYCQGLSLLGGEPFVNTSVCLSLVRAVRQQFNHTKDIWAWTGYTFEELLHSSPDKISLLSYIDVLVDGPFDIKQRDLSLQFRGSRNQRVIDVQKSLNQNKICIWEHLIQ